MSSRRDINEEVFLNEVAFQDRVRRVFEEPPESFDELWDEYTALSHKYNKLLRQALKMNRLADSAQSKLMKLKNRLERQNEQIVKQQEDLVEINAKLKEASLTDALTGLRNRRFLASFLEQDIENILRANKEKKNRNILFMMLDIDHFKDVNDTYGHAAGDLVLIQVARVIQHNCRRGDIPVRWGGEEFLMVCRETERDLGGTMAERLRSEIERTRFHIGDERYINLTCSIGFAFFPFYLENPTLLNWHQVVDVADHALYAAKKSNRNAWVGVVSQAEGQSLDESEATDLGTLVQDHNVSISSSLENVENLVW